jgi:hypothetical protein
MELKDLTEEQKSELFAALEAEKKAKAARIAAERDAYKDIVDTTVRETAKFLRGVSRHIMEAKAQVFEAFETVIAMKTELYGIRDRQQTHSFTTSDGMLSITVGNRVNEGWDDTVNAGIAKVQDFLQTLARDDNSAALVETVMRLLSRDRKGNLKASRVLELDRLAAKIGDDGLLDALKIIKDAYRPSPTCRFVEVSVRDANGAWRSLPLSMSAAGQDTPEIPEIPKIPEE